MVPGMTARHRAVLLGLAAVVLATAVVLAVSGRDGDRTTGVIDTRTQPTATVTAPATSTAPAAAPVDTTTGPTATTDATPAGSGGAPAPTEQTTVTVRAGEPVGGPKRLRFRQGSTIVLTVRSADGSAGEVHLHGYDVTRRLRPGGSVSFAVPARIAGIFEVELEATATEIAKVEVVP